MWSLAGTFDWFWFRSGGLGVEGRSAVVDLWVGWCGGCFYIWLGGFFGEWLPLM